MQDLKIGYLQTELHWQDRQRNRQMLEKKARQAEDSYDVLILPEMFDTGFSMTPEQIAEQTASKTTSWMLELAAKLKSAVCGSVMEKVENRYYNRFYWATAEGILLHYDKKHLFRMGREPRHYSAGSEKIIISYKGWKILPMICYDLRFPVWSANYNENGKPAYDMLIYVANWPGSRKDAWLSLLKARALENQSYCIGVNRVGRDKNRLVYSGDSVAFNYRGEIIVQCAPHLENNVIFTASWDDLHKFREKFPVYKDWQ